MSETPPTCYLCLDSLAAEDVVLKFIDGEFRPHCDNCTPPYRCLACKKTLTPAQAHRLGNQGWTVEYHFCNDCRPCSSRGTGVTPEWMQRPEPTPEEKAAHEATYANYMAQFEGRGHLGATRCTACGEFGVFADSGLCPECDEALTRSKAAEKERQAALCDRWAAYWRASGKSALAAGYDYAADVIRRGHEPPAGEAA